MRIRFGYRVLIAAASLAMQATLVAAERPAADPIVADLKILPQVEWEWGGYCGGREQPPELAVSFEFQGKAASLASRIDGVHLDSFLDGNDKSQKWRCRTSASLRDPDWKGRVQVSLAIPNRPAIRSIREVRGSVLLETGGDYEKVLLKNAFKEIDDPIADKRLDALGVRITPMRPLEPFFALQSQEEDCVTVRADWNMGAAVAGRACGVTACELLDSRGKPIPLQGVGDNGTDSSREFSFRLKTRVPPDAQLRLTIHKAGRNVRVPFALNDAPVPKVPAYLDIPIPPGGEYVEATPVSPSDPILAGLKTDVDVSWNYRPDLDVRVRLHGTPVELASAFGEAEIDSVIDENGHAVYLNDCFAATMNRRFCPVSFDKDGAEIVLRTREQPFPKVIHELKGSVAIQTGGHLETVIVKDILKNIGKPVESEALKALGMTVQVAEHKKGLGREYGGPESLRIYFAWGPKTVIHHFDVLDGEGEVVECAGSSGLDTTCVADLSGTYRKKLGPDTQLRIVVQKDSRKVRVPFVLKDIEVKPAPKEQE